MSDKRKKKDAIKKQAKKIEEQFGLLGSPWDDVIDGLIDVFVGDDGEEEESTESTFNFGDDNDDDDFGGFGGGDSGGGGASSDW